MNPMIREIVKQLQKAVVGKEEILLKILMAILARGHILMEDSPGVGKTTTALAFAQALGLSQKRLQLTPDVLPSDVVGFTLYDQASGEMKYHPGAAICNLLLADELNRASSRTQSALLEAMEEGSVTVDGVTHPLPQPFTVIATQNPFGSAGTQPIPESQADRFMLRLTMGYPAPEAEMEILRQPRWENPLIQVERVAGVGELMEMQKQVEEVYISDELCAYIVRLAHATRSHPSLALGVSPRGSLALVRIAKASAYLAGRDYVIPADIQEMLTDAWAHRIVLIPQARRERLQSNELLTGLLRSFPLPHPGRKYS